MLRKILMFASLTVMSFSSFGGELTANRIMLTYLDGLEGGLRVALETTENVSPAQIANLNRTVMQTAVKRGALESVAKELFSEQIARGANVDDLIKHNPDMIVKELDKSISIAQMRLEAYHKAVVDSKVIGFRPGSLQDAEVRKVESIVSKINKSRKVNRLPAISREIMSSPFIQVVTDINYHSSREATAAARLTVRLGKTFTERLLRNLYKAI